MFWVYSGLALVMAVYAALAIPDMRGLSLVKIERREEERRSKEEERRSKEEEEERREERTK